MERKAVVVVDRALPRGLQANVAAVLAMSFGSAHPELIGHETCTADGVRQVGLPTLPLPILQADEIDLRHLAAASLPTLDWLAVYTAAALASKTYAVYTAAALASKTYAVYTETLASARADELAVHAVALFGERRRINRLTGGFALLR
ncbi:DUF2000 domain-containing protein [Acidihalobacter ferrooxydans]|uniref:DUF2000 domain-containing protein n=1 Tax=Acidihalobacter ferrooxydans TaxID=1765967 RepID=A0A1P8UIA8_9GAMM|nr:DUF2000 domain-containing protein [Acidihalobacter ferrooxydans]APZ43570.1 hypothetical protein BW247_11110 [Acidihalobacter ferrooxydans]